MAELKTKTPEPLDVYYMKMLGDNVDARKGKLKVGQVVPMERAQAERYLATNMAVQVAGGEFEDQQGRKVKKATAAQAAFQAINDGHAMWDVSTYRDVLTAPESGLRQAHARGIPLVNVYMLRDEDGDTLAPDADIDDILDARALLHPDIASPYAAHDRSSVMGGGSPYQSNMAPMPLSPQHRAAQQRIADNELLAQKPAAFSYDRNNPGAKSGREARAERRASSSAPEPKLAPNAQQAAKDAGVVAPQAKLNDDQKV